jgi:SAM-dependent methyltransferase
MVGYRLPHDYRPRAEPAYPDDTAWAAGTLIHQPEVYDAADYLRASTGRTTVLDLGCGNGRKLLGMGACRRIGVDFGNNIAWCRGRFPASAEWIEADLSARDCARLADLAGPQTVVVCADVIQHLPDPVPLLRLLSRCYLNGAIVVTSTPDRVRVRGEQHKGPPPNPTHVREWALREYAAFLADHGLPAIHAGYTINNTVARALKTIATIHDAAVTAALMSPAHLPPPVAILAAYNEADVIREVADDLLQQGCDLVAVDNWSDDDTWEILRGLADEASSRVRVERFPPDGPAPHYEWRDILRRKEEVALGFAGRWIIHTDADELRRSPFQGKTLAEGLSVADRNQANRVGFNLINFRPVDDAPYRPGTLARHFKRFEFGSKPGHFLQAKAWRQGAQRVDLASSGGHVAAFAGARDFPYRFLLRHYPIRSVEHGRKKILQDRQGRWSPLERNVLGWHSQYDELADKADFIWQSSELHGFDEQFCDDYGLMIMTDIPERRSTRDERTPDRL